MARPHLSIPLVLILTAAVLACGGIVAALASGGGSSGTREALPPGPRLAFLEIHYPRKQDEPGTKAIEEGTRIVSVDPSGRGRVPLFPTPGLTLMSIGRVSWSGDGEELAFLAAPTAPGRVRPRAYVAAADGSDTRSVPGTEGTFAAVLSPDGKSVAFTRSRGGYSGESTTWIAPVVGGRPRRLTPWRHGLLATPSSFSPDGRTLLVSMTLEPGPEDVDAIDLATGKVRTIESQATQAAYSPDGTEIAFISYRDGETVPGFDDPEPASELYVADADGAGARRISHTPELEETYPSWDPGGNRLGYLRTPGGMLEFLGVEGEVVESNADGGCAKVIAKPPKLGKEAQAAVQPPSWRPGPGRGVGPLSC
jgi:Tol biopolymer transport system component